MTTINWIKCSDRMPPDDENICIVRHPDGTPFKATGEWINDLAKKATKEIPWIPFDEATWKELNK